MYKIIKIQKIWINCVKLFFPYTSCNGPNEVIGGALKTDSDGIAASCKKKKNIVYLQISNSVAD